MQVFASNTVNRIDKKGRVSIPASFRAVLKDQTRLHALLSVDYPIAEIAGPEMMALYRKRLEQMDPFSQEFDDWSFYLFGNASEMKLDGEGRIQLNDNIREQTGIEEEVLFEGRGQSFWIWEPGKYEAYRDGARARVRELRRSLGSASGVSADAGRRAGS